MIVINIYHFGSGESQKMYGEDEWIVLAKNGHKISNMRNYNLMNYKISVSYIKNINNKLHFHKSTINHYNNDNHKHDHKDSLILYKMQGNYENIKKLVIHNDDSSKKVLFIEKNIKLRTMCRNGNGGDGFDIGSFSWGIDVIDSRSLNIDNKYCPFNNLNGSGVNVFILDTGFVYPLPKDVIPENLIREYDAYNSDIYCQDKNGHGTNTASLIISTIYGGAPGVKLHIHKVLNDQGSGSISNVIESLMIINNTHNDGIISLSIGVYDDTTQIPSPSLAYIINLLISKFIFVIAAGNDRKDSCYNFPSNIPGVISVGAIDINKNMAYFTNYGSCVSLFAPGVGIIANGISETIFPLYSGTSQSTPIVTSAFALYKQYYKQEPNSFIISSLLNSTTRNSIIGIDSISPNKIINVGSFSYDNRSFANNILTSNGPSLSHIHTDINQNISLFLILLPLYFFVTN